jgi:hypothetical protein
MGEEKKRKFFLPKPLPGAVLELGLITSYF